jgi:peptide/nickel transport system substrate-binding protein
MRSVKPPGLEVLMNRKILRVTCLLLFMILLAGCGGLAATPTPPATATAVPPPPTPTVDPRLGGRLNVRLSHDLEKLTPLQLADDVEAGWIVRLFYPGLTRLDDHLRPQPDLAESWTVSPDGLAITFTLRPDLRWSDGVTLTAADVRFTWDMLRTWEPRLGVQADLHDYVAAVTTPTTRTVTFVLNRRLAGLLADASFPVLPEHVWGDLPAQSLLETDLLGTPVSSGPVLLKERWPGQALVLERNPGYYGPALFLGQIAFLVAPNEQVAEVALREGDLHLALVPPAAYYSLATEPSQVPLRLARYPAAQYTFVGFNLRPGYPLADPLVRQAWALALDKEALVAAATGGEGIPLWSPILPPSWAYDAELPHTTQNLEQARGLLATAGWSDSDGDGIVEKAGRPLRVRLFVRADVPERVAACQQMAGLLAQVGISVEVIPSDFASVLAAKLRPPYDFDALCMQWRDLGPDPDLFYLFHSSQAWQGPDDQRQNLYNFVGYESEEADRLILAGRDNYDPARRRDSYVQLQRLLAQDLPYYMLWADPVYLAADAHLTTDEGPVNLETPTFFWNVEKWYLQQ